jgi:peptide/nickel transport system permease protein
LMGLARYVARRTVYTVLLVLVIVVFNFFLFQVLPFLTSCPGMTYRQCAITLYVPTVPPRGSQNVTAYFEHLKVLIMKAYGFDDPLLTRFVLYVKNMLTFNFGYNTGGIQGVSGTTVLSVIQTRAPFTILLLGTSTVAAFLIGIGLGVVAAAKRGKVLDVASLAVLLFLNALPVFFLGAMLMLAQLQLTETSYVGFGAATLLASGLDYYAALLQTMFLPFVTLTLAGLGGVFLTQRAVMIDTVAEDYVLMARAKGLPERTVLYKHAFRNAVLPIVTAFAISIGFILAGAVITETVFGWPGLGLAIYDGVLGVDFPLEQAMFFIITLMVLVAIFAADVLYGFLDPRVSTG